MTAPGRATPPDGANTIATKNETIPEMTEMAGPLPIPESARVLYLGPVDERFDPERDIVLGPHCFIGREDLCPEWQSLAFVDAFESKAQVYEVQKDLLRLVNHLIPNLAERLNRQHDAAYSVDFWRILVLPWLLELSQAAWTEYTLFQRLIERYGDEPVRISCFRQAPPWRFSDVASFAFALMGGARFNLWFDSVILATLAPASWQLHEVNTPAGADPTPLPRRPISVLRSLKHHLGYSDILGTRIGGLLLAVFANLLPKRPFRYTIHPQDDFAPETVFPKAFLDLMSYLIDATMPESYGAAFPELIAQAQRYRYRPGRLRIGTIDLWNDDEKAIAASAKEAGERLIIAQHGGGYATTKWHVHTTEYEYLNGTFITWGWSDYDDHNGHFVGLPSPSLSKFADRHRQRDDRMIMVGDPIRLRMRRLNSGPMGSGWLNYCRQTQHFLSALPASIRNSTVFRPYMGTGTDFVHAYVSGPFPEIPILESGFHDALLNCKLLVLRGPGTTLNMAMAANVPTVLVYEHDLWPLCRTAEPFFHGLQDNGILFHDLDDAARHIEAHWNDIDGWWQSDGVQTARRRWASHFARTDRFWWWHWAVALNRLSRESLTE
jgi:putative transferase (TIGR04331 family)